MDEIESVASLDAQKFAVDSRMIAIVAADDLVVADTQRGLAAIGTMRTNSSDVMHFPGPRLIAIHAACQRAHRADVDAHAAFIALQVIEMVGSDFRMSATIDHAQRVHAHALI